MQTNNYIYVFGYNITENELCKLESRYVFDKEEEKKQLFSDIKVEPSNSAFIKKRLDIILSSEDYPTLINDIKKLDIHVEGFKVEYVVLEGDTTKYADRLSKLKDIGYSIEGIPDYYKPTITYAICYSDGIWYFGLLHKNTYDWQKHNKKPYSYSNSININIAKALVNIAAKTNKDAKLLDACCGVGTIMLEACYAGNNIEGTDINWKVCRQARINLSHFNYPANISCADIKDVSNRYDAIIIDLPYNLLSCADEDTVIHIISSAAKISDRLVVVSATDISKIILQLGLKISDHCNISKLGKTDFTREIWICKKQ
ncbi:MAG: TRM11 family methyltransferase [Hyphomicrobiales bacterium]